MQDERELEPAEAPSKLKCTLLRVVDFFERLSPFPSAAVPTHSSRSSAVRRTVLLSSRLDPPAFSPSSSPAQSPVLCCRDPDSRCCSGLPFFPRSAALRHSRRFRPRR